MWLVKLFYSLLCQAASTSWKPLKNILFRSDIFYISYFLYLFSPLVLKLKPYAGKQDFCVLKYLPGLTIFIINKTVSILKILHVLGTWFKH